ncbi:MAG: 2-C-methyl-D-erythritol 4-phosphate cytidylyltransferase [Actinomycetota bacterium]|nr:2-C-methyl-D-erythritol 4-phosphate cytidylyltransferase [Actinomycetota bacterium]
MNIGLIVAAGNSARFAPGDKQFTLLAGRPMLAYSIDAFARARVIDMVILVVRAQDQRRCQADIVGPAALAKPVSVVAGGEKRQQSVAVGLKACPRGVDLVFVHDGARPLITADQIDAMAANLGDFDGLVLAACAYDTIKQAEDGIIKRTIPRQEVWHAQTPQLFRYATLEQAHMIAEQAGFAATDDSTLVELMGGRVAICPNEQDNLKVTTTADLRLAEQILRTRL